MVDAFFILPYDNITVGFLFQICDTYGLFVCLVVNVLLIKNAICLFEYCFPWFIKDCLHYKEKQKDTFSSIVMKTSLSSSARCIHIISQSVTSFYLQDTKC